MRGISKTNICIDCVNSCNGSCSWAMKHEPVEGWTAKPIKYYTGKGIVKDSFEISDCPNLETDKRVRRRSIGDRTGCLWTDDEIKQLKVFWYHQERASVIAQKLGRPVKGIQRKIKELKTDGKL